MSTGDPTGRLAAIHIYPLKGARGLHLRQSLVQPWGLAGDRRWLVVDPAGRFVSQREEPRLARLLVRYTEPAGNDGAAIDGQAADCAAGQSPVAWGEGAIIIAAGGRSPISVEPPRCAAGAEMLPVSVWRAELLAAAAGADADLWLSDFLGRPVRLAYLDDPRRRPVDDRYGAVGDVVSFADGYPLLVTSTASLDALGKWLADDGDEPVPMSRFRPNAVVADADPWDEDHWRRLRIGAVSFRAVKPCGRCVVTTVDQVTGERGSQPLRMLGRRRRLGQDLVFGQNLIPDGPGVIRAGDSVEIVQRAG